MAPGVGNEVGAAPGVCGEVEAVPFADGEPDVAPRPRSSDFFAALW